MTKKGAGRVRALRDLLYHEPLVFFNFCVWTLAIEGFCQVAIMAKHLKTFGEVILDQPVVYGRAATSQIAPVLCPIVVNVVDSKKTRFGFTTTRANITIGIKHKRA